MPKTTPGPGTSPDMIPRDTRGRPFPAVSRVRVRLRVRQDPEDSKASQGLTIHHPKPKNDYEAVLIFMGSFSPAFYLPGIKMIVVTQRITLPENFSRIGAIIGHEETHRVLHDFIGLEATVKFDELDRDIKYNLDELKTTSENKKGE